MRNAALIVKDNGERNPEVGDEEALVRDDAGEDDGGEERHKFEMAKCQSTYAQMTHSRLIGRISSIGLNQFPFLIDDMGKKDADKDANRLREDKSGEDSEAEKRDMAAINEETDKAFTVRQNDNSLENSTVHAGENNQAVVAVTINTKVMDDRQLKLPESATNPILELVEVSNNEGTQFTHGLESIVQDSLKADLENETSSLKSVVQESEALVIESQEGIYLHQEIEKNAGVNNSPGSLDSNCQLRASQVQGITLQVELHPNDSRKEHRKKLRRQQYDNSQSQRYEENQEGDSAESDSDEQRQAMLEYELQSTTDVGNRLGIRYEKGDIRAIKKMIKIEAKDYFLLLRNKTSK
ncbi:hypothetical protein RHGRI_006361 [Rhododendron griersonianum]|uniref:Uncharacterized protein n=1 Tax=Rhododendron griersonianum TaxID=479676 RepID=A0AAV6KSP3_9ERIC|nr:hypothetical protein RHGRI_006361 [Rhododendron griersonianum]